MIAHDGKRDIMIENKFKVLGEVDMKLDFYYFSYQCPLNDNMLQLLDEYRDKIEIHLHDIANNCSLAAKMNIFFPTLTMLDGEKRYYSPLKKSFLELVSKGIYPEESPFLPTISELTVAEIIEPLKIQNIEVACACCGNKTENNCLKKQEFLKKYKQDVYGFIHKDMKGNLIGGAEYLPAEFIPYNIPHDKNTAFITCVYMSDSEFDYKSAPLKALEEYLKKDYEKIIAISDENGIFPNGNLKFFINNGYQDEGIIFTDTKYCRLHLVSKLL